MGNPGLYIAHYSSGLTGVLCVFLHSENQFQGGLCRAIVARCCGVAGVAAAAGIKSAIKVGVAAKSAAIIVGHEMLEAAPRLGTRTEREIGHAAMPTSRHADKLAEESDWRQSLSEFGKEKAIDLTKEVGKKALESLAHNNNDPRHDFQSNPPRDPWARFDLNKVAEETFKQSRGRSPSK